MLTPLQACVLPAPACTVLSPERGSLAVLFESEAVLLKEDLLGVKAPQESWREDVCRELTQSGLS